MITQHNLVFASFFGKVTSDFAENARWTSLPTDLRQLMFVDWFHHNNWFGPPSSNTWTQVNLKIKRRLMEKPCKMREEHEKNL